MPQINLDYLKDFVSEAEISSKKKAAENALSALVDKTGAGAEFTGFVSLPKDYDRDELLRIKRAAEKIR